MHSWILWLWVGTVREYYNTKFVPRLKFWKQTTGTPWNVLFIDICPEKILTVEIWKSVLPLILDNLCFPIASTDNLINTQRALKIYSTATLPNKYLWVCLKYLINNEFNTTYLTEKMWFFSENAKYTLDNIKGCAFNP